MVGKSPILTPSWSHIFLVYINKNLSFLLQISLSSLIPTPPSGEPKRMKETFSSLMPPWENMSEIMEKVVLFSALHMKNRLLWSLNYWVKWHRQLKHTVRLNPFILPPCDKVSETTCWRKRNTAKLRQWGAWSRPPRVRFHGCNMQPALPHWCRRESKKMGLGKQVAVLAAQVTNPPETKTHSGKWWRPGKGRCAEGRARRAEVARWVPLTHRSHTGEHPSGHAPGSI